MTNKIKYILAIFALSLVVSCKSFLEEDPKSLLTAQYLETEDGVNAALNAAYSDLRYNYGTEAAMVNTCSGTDNWQTGPGSSSDFYFYGSGMNTAGSIDGMWNWNYTLINSCNAVLTYVNSCGMSEANALQTEAEARYLRATAYFILVQTYGDIPLRLEYITEASSEATRTAASEVYATIIEDLEFAKSNLAATASEPGRATAAAAYHLLAKVYLTRATHEDAAQSSDYQSAYNNAKYLIDNAADFGVALLPDFADVFTPGNESNSEVLFTVQVNSDIVYNDAGNPSGSGASYKNSITYMLFNPNYPTWVSGLIRDIPYGRPWHRTRPTNYLLEEVFNPNNRSDDTRYNKTFRTVWLVNDPDNVADASFAEGDTAAWLPGVENYDASVRALVIFPPSSYYGENGNTASIYPYMMKYRDVDRPDMNESAVRPFIVYRFAETYLIAAEAAMYLNRPAEAINYLNIIRDRAAYNPDRSSADYSLAVQRMHNQVPSMTNINEGIAFILEERSRELCGEHMRWWDLVRTRRENGESQLVYRLQNLTPTIPFGSNVRDFHVLRPLPQDELDLVSNDDFVNNPGY